MLLVDPLIGAIEFGNQQWVWLVVGIVVAALVALFVSYKTASQSGRFKSLLILLKITGIALVAICLLNPTLVRQRIRPGENIIALLADNSASMKIQDADEESRSSQVVDLIKKDRAEWLTRLTQDFDLRQYQFAERLSKFDSIEALTFDGRRSQLANALTDLSQNLQSQPFAAVLLFTDGNASDINDLDSLEFNVPVYPVVFKSAETSLFDISIDQVSVSESPFEDAPVVISGVLSTTSSDPVQALVELFQVGQADDQKTQRKQLTIPPNESVPISFQLKPNDIEIKADANGLFFYNLSVLQADDEKGTPLEDEATLANNERIISLNRKRTKNRILYVGGRPNWEYKFFNRAVSEDKQVHLVSLIRIARKEAKFDFRGRVGEEANSLFRGQDREADEETESFDEAVLIRLNTRDEAELSGGFPKTKEELFQYDGLILDDVEASFFSQDQQKLLDRFVAERGGGLLMLGGRDSFRHGAWQKTPLRDVLPIYLDQTEEPVGNQLKWNLTREGWLEPWMRVHSTEVEEQTRLGKVPALEILNSTRETKPGSRVFAELEDQNGAKHPAVVAHQYGQGRAAAVLAGDLWRWSMKREEVEDDDLGQSWRQMLRWLVADVPQRIEAEVEWTQIGDVPAVELQVRLRDEEYQPRENSVVKMNIKAPDGKTIELTAEPSLTETGLFSATYLPRLEGPFEAEISATDESDPIPKVIHVGWTHKPDIEEFRNIELNLAALESLAKRTGGEVVAADQLSDFVKSLPQREMPKTEIQSTPLWHSPYILLVALACFAGEWGLRRWKGLP